MSWRILQGDARSTLEQLPERTVQTCVTSPPYFGLRDYGTGQWEGGDPACDHGAARQQRRQEGRQTDLGGGTPGSLRDPPRTACSCGATRTDHQIGLEGTVDEYVQALVDVFRAVRRVLRDDGTAWLNLGDSYAGGSIGRRDAGNAIHRNDGRAPEATSQKNGLDVYRPRAIPDGVKPKDLIGVPWRVAFALQADGWWLRSEIIWAKPNPMPESVTDRPTRAHEQVFLLAKQPRYFFDADAIREEHADSNESRLDALRQHGDGAVGEWIPGSAQANDPHRSQLDHRGLPGVGTTFGRFNSSGRNKRSVWSIATQPYAGAHFATFPAKLIEPCILAGSPPGGLVLDPFAGSGTTGVVALRHNRSFIGCELNESYVELARRRICDDAPLLNTGIEDVAA